MQRLGLSLIPLLALTALAACGGANLQRDELQVTKVVLYQNGVGYFERHGTFTGQELKLRVRTDQINDMLMSLTVLDLEPGAKPVSISLPVEKSSAMVLGELPNQLRSAGGLLGVLDAFRGSDVRLAHSKGSAAGRIVGTERYTTNDGVDAWRVSLLTANQQIVPVDLNAITRIDLHDRTLSVGLEKVLDVALGEGAWKPTELVVRFPDDGKHQVLMSYVVAMPTWKPAYRIVFDAKGDTHLQGWAVVDNLSGEAWSDVSLSLTAGTPISFVVDLHSPRLPYRADLTHRTYSARTETPPQALAAFQAPAEASPVVTAPAPQAKSADRAPASGRARPAPDYAENERLADRAMAPAPPPPTMSADLMVSTLDSGATGEQVGALFRYDVLVPVTIPDQGSAMVPIVNAKIDGEDVLLYDPSGGSARARNTPYRAVRLTNDTGYVLEQGPLTIYKDATFVGEGIAQQIGLGQSVFIPYTLEPGLHVEQDTAHSQEANKLVKIKDGVMTVESHELRQTHFTVTNHRPDPLTLYARVDKVRGFDIDPDGDHLTQGDVYFVKITTDGQVTKHSVTQRRKRDTTLALADPSAMNVLQLYINNVDANPTVRAQLEGIIALKGQIGDIEHRRRTVEQRQRELYARAQELRNNINVLGKSQANASLRNELAKKLMDTDAELSKLDREIVQLGERKYALEVQVREAFSGITLN